VRERRCASTNHPDRGFADALARKPARYPGGIDALSYASGFVEGNARRREIEAANNTSAGKVLLFRDKRQLLLLFAGRSKLRGDGCEG
jgi:hypothetical protein